MPPHKDPAMIFRQPSLQEPVATSGRVSSTLHGDAESPFHCDEHPHSLRHTLKDIQNSGPFHASGGPDVYMSRGSETLPQDYTHSNDSLVQIPKTPDRLAGRSISPRYHANPSPASLPRCHPLGVPASPTPIVPPRTARVPLHRSPRVTKAISTTSGKTRMSVEKIFRQPSPLASSLYSTTRSSQTSITAGSFQAASSDDAVLPVAVTDSSFLTLPRRSSPLLAWSSSSEALKDSIYAEYFDTSSSLATSTDGVGCSSPIAVSRHSQVGLLLEAAIDRERVDCDCYSISPATSASACALAEDVLAPVITPNQKRLGRRFGSTHPSRGDLETPGQPPADRRAKRWGLNVIPSGLPEDMLATLGELEELAGTLKREKCSSLTLYRPRGTSSEPLEVSGELSRLVREATEAGEPLDIASPQLCYPRDGTKISCRLTWELPRLNASDKEKWRAADSKGTTDIGLEPTEEMAAASREPSTPVRKLESTAARTRPKSAFFIYDQWTAPKFLVGHSKSSIVKPARGYHSKPMPVHLLDLLRTSPRAQKSRLPFLFSRPAPRCPQSPPAPARKSCEARIESRALVRKTTQKGEPRLQEPRSSGFLRGKPSNETVPTVPLIPTALPSVASSFKIFSYGRQVSASGRPRGVSESAMHRPVKGPGSGKPRFSLAKGLMKKLNST